MKLFVYSALFILLSLTTRAQKVTNLSVSFPIVTINAKIIGKDSVIVPFNDKYWVVEDGCAQIIRYGHYDFKKRTFLGKFKDVLKTDSNLVVTEGSYSNGVKNGPFVFYYTNGKVMTKCTFKKGKYNGDWISYYANGNLKSKGNFDNDKFIGDWKLYYEDGRPKLSFFGKGKVCKIIDVWDAAGNKTVNNGTGDYETDNGTTWKGSLVNGLPDGRWSVDASVLSPENDAEVIEYFKNNDFIKGYAHSGQFTSNYTDESHISLFPQLASYNLDHAEYLDIVTDCNGVNYSEFDLTVWGKTTHRRKITYNLGGSGSVKIGAKSSGSGL